jgi:hypothetical protein
MLIIGKTFDRLFLKNFVTRLLEEIFSLPKVRFATVKKSLRVQYLKQCHVSLCAIIRTQSRKLTVIERLSGLFKFETIQ